jgi:hypothetical protein
MSKPFLENMSKENRQAFCYLESFIGTSKMECLAAIPKTQVYNDTEIKRKIELIESKIASSINEINTSIKLLELTTDYIKFIKSIINIQRINDERLYILEKLYECLKTYVLTQKIDAKEAI